MSTDILIHQCCLHLWGQDYEILVYRRANGTLMAQTVFAPEDVIINDGFSLEDVLDRHQRLLPLAVKSRLILKDLSGPS